MSPIRDNPIGTRVLVFITLVTAGLIAFIPLAIFLKLNR